MKYSWKLFFVALAVSAVAACGAAGDESDTSATLDPQPEDLATNSGLSDVKTSPTNSGGKIEDTSGARASSAASDDNPSEAIGTDPTILGKTCYADCTVLNLGGSCPTSVSGWGYTTFLGGCNKACTRAQGDAQSKLPSGCTVNKCYFSGC